MKMTLSQALVLNRLSIDHRPVIVAGGGVKFEPNAKLEPYIVFDNHRDSPVGFGVKVGRTKKTYIIQRRVKRSHTASGEKSGSNNQVRKAKVGNVSDFNTIDDAREAARKKVQSMVETGQNPNVLARQLADAEITLGKAFADYRRDLVNRATPATKNTLMVLDKALERLDSWRMRPINELTSDEIISRFQELASKTRTAAEQTFRWAIAATNSAIIAEGSNALAQRRGATLSYNPFRILKEKRMFRDRKKLEKDYQARGVRNPLSDDMLGKWFDALHKRREKNRTGCDYLILTTLWGTRRMEGLPLVWHDMISQDEAIECSYVDLANRRVFFHDTKNRENHMLPLADGAYKILLERHALSIADETERRRRWVFPAKRLKAAKKPEVAVEHYSDMRTLLDALCKDAGISRLSMHDLRRTFGRIADANTSYATVKRLLNHGRHADPTSRYTTPEEAKVIEVMQRMETMMLSSSPSLYNAIYADQLPPQPGHQLEGNMASNSERTK
jgi:integrase